MLELCLATIHVDITSSWNFNDPDNVCLASLFSSICSLDFFPFQLLNSKSFQNQIKALAQLVTPDREKLDSWLCVLRNVFSIHLLTL